MDKKINIKTYKDLLNLLNKLDDKTLSQTLTISLDQDDFFAASVYVYQDDTVLDQGHLYIGIEEENENK